MTDEEKEEIEIVINEMIDIANTNRNPFFICRKNSTKLFMYILCN